MTINTEVDVAIIGAGSAGIAAAKVLREHGVSFKLLEASHRIGGRGYTEEVAPGVMFDLGCHWLHSASLNPYVAIADRFGFTYQKTPEATPARWENGWISAKNQAQLDTYLDTSEESIQLAAEQGNDVSMLEVIDYDSRWATTFDTYVSLDWSSNADQVSVLDWFHNEDTEEDWPVKEGYGNLIEQFGADVPVELNCLVESVRWHNNKIQLRTPKGELTSRHVIITVSTGVLGASDIRFVPELPRWKQEAIHALPLGNHNRICLTFDKNVFGDQHPESVYYADGDDDQFMIYVRPFDQNYIVGVTGGRLAWWLEKAGVQASVDHTKERLGKMFGAEVEKAVVGHTVTAWGSDPWIKGAYAAARPSQFHQRHQLAQSIDNRLHFAGEATSSQFFATAHGAYLSGMDTAERVAKSLS